MSKSVLRYELDKVNISRIHMLFYYSAPLASFLYQSQVGYFLFRSYPKEDICKIATEHFRPTGKPLPCPQK